MDGNGPCQPQGELRVGANLLLHNLLLFCIECVLDIAPYLPLHIHVLSVLRTHVDVSVFLVADTDDGAQRAIDPTLLTVVADKQHLCPRLDFEFDGCRQAALGKLALDRASEHSGFAGQGMQMLVVDVVHGVASG